MKTVPTVSLITSIAKRARRLASHQNGPNKTMGIKDTRNTGSYPSLYFAMSVPPPLNVNHWRMRLKRILDPPDFLTRAMLGPNFQEVARNSRQSTSQKESPCNTDRHLIKIVRASRSHSMPCIPCSCREQFKWAKGMAVEIGKLTRVGAIATCARLATMPTMEETV